jgi:hypothetical protein
MQDHKRSIECKCPCHFGTDLFHIKKCCQGQCNHCLKWFKSFLLEHKQFCKTNNETPICISDMSDVR